MDIIFEQNDIILVDNKVKVKQKNTKICKKKLSLENVFFTS